MLTCTYLNSNLQQVNFPLLFSSPHTHSENVYPQSSQYFCRWVDSREGKHIESNEAPREVRYHPALSLLVYTKCDRLRCKQCKKLKSVPGFSQRQLGIAKQSFAKNPKLNEQGIAIAVCRQCTEGQVMELECSQCNLIKSLEGFTKAQRRDPDFAVSTMKHTIL